MKRVIVASLLSFAFASVALGQTCEYKSVMTDAEMEACRNYVPPPKPKPLVAKPLSPEEKAILEKRDADLTATLHAWEAKNKAEQEAIQKRHNGWQKLCRSEGHDTVESASDCTTRQVIAYEEMTKLIKSNPAEAERQKILACAVKWDKPAIDNIDAVMWRYCYYH